MFKSFKANPHWFVLKYPDFFSVKFAALPETNQEMCGLANFKNLFY